MKPLLLILSASILLPSLLRAGTAIPAGAAQAAPEKKEALALDEAKLSLRRLARVADSAAKP